MPRVEADPRGVSLHNVGDASIGQPCALYALAFGDRTVSPLTLVFGRGPPFSA